MPEGYVDDTLCEKSQLSASISWLLNKAFVSGDKIPDVYKQLFDGSNESCLSHYIVTGLCSCFLYSAACCNLFQSRSESWTDHGMILKNLRRRGIPVLDDKGSQITQTQLQRDDPHTQVQKSHLALVNGIMLAYIEEIVSKSAVEEAVNRFCVSTKTSMSNSGAAENLEVPRNTEQALHLWLVEANKAALRDSPIPSDRNFDLTARLCLLVNFYHPANDATAETLSLTSIKLNKSLSRQDQLDNLQHFRSFCGRLSSNPFLIHPVDFLEARHLLQRNVSCLMAELFHWFERSGRFKPGYQIYRTYPHLSLPVTSQSNDVDTSNEENHPNAEEDSNDDEEDEDERFKTPEEEEPKLDDFIVLNNKSALSSHDGPVNNNDNNNTTTWLDFARKNVSLPRRGSGTVLTENNQDPSNTVDLKIKLELKKRQIEIERQKQLSMSKVDRHKKGQEIFLQLVQRNNSSSNARKVDAILSNSQSNSNNVEEVNHKSHQGSVSSESYDEKLDKLNYSLSSLQDEIKKLSLQQDKVTTAVKDNMLRHKSDSSQSSRSLSGSYHEHQLQSDGSASSSSRTTEFSTQTSVRDPLTPSVESVTPITPSRYHPFPATQHHLPLQSITNNTASPFFGTHPPSTQHISHHQQQHLPVVKPRATWNKTSPIDSQVQQPQHLQSPGNIGTGNSETVTFASLLARRTAQQPNSLNVSTSRSGTFPMHHSMPPHQSNHSVNNSLTHSTVTLPPRKRPELPPEWSAVLPESQPMMTQSTTSSSDGSNLTAVSMTRSADTVILPQSNIPPLSTISPSPTKTQGFFIAAEEPQEEEPLQITKSNFFVPLGDSEESNKPKRPSRKPKLSSSFNSRKDLESARDGKDSSRKASFKESSKDDESKLSMSVPTEVKPAEAFDVINSTTNYPKNVERKESMTSVKSSAAVTVPVRGPVSEEGAAKLRELQERQAARLAELEKKKMQRERVEEAKALEKARQREAQQTKKAEEKQRREEIFREYQRKKNSETDYQESPGSNSTTPSKPVTSRSASAARPRSMFIANQGSPNLQQHRVKRSPSTHDLPGTRLAVEDNSGQLTHRTQSIQHIPSDPDVKLFVKPKQKSNKTVIHNALAHCCLAGIVNDKLKKSTLHDLDVANACHFMILFRDGGCQYRALYSFNVEEELLTRVSGRGPRYINNTMVHKFLKYNSGAKKFSLIDSTKHLSAAVDAITIMDTYWKNSRSASARR